MSRLSTWTIFAALLALLVVSQAKFDDEFIFDDDESSVIQDAEDVIGQSDLDEADLLQTRLEDAMDCGFGPGLADEEMDVALKVWEKCPFNSSIKKQLKSQKKFKKWAKSKCTGCKSASTAAKKRGRGLNCKVLRSEILGSNSKITRKEKKEKKVEKKEEKKEKKVKKVKKVKKTPKCHAKSKHPKCKQLIKKCRKSRHPKCKQVRDDFPKWHEPEWPLLPKVKKTTPRCRKVDKNVMKRTRKCPKASSMISNGMCERTEKLRKVGTCKPGWFWHKQRALCVQEFAPKHPKQKVKEVFKVCGASKVVKKQIKEIKHAKKIVRIKSLEKKGQESAAKKLKVKVEKAEKRVIKDGKKEIKKIKVITKNVNKKVHSFKKFQMGTGVWTKHRWQLWMNAVRKMKSCWGATHTATQAAQFVHKFHAGRVTPSWILQKRAKINSVLFELQRCFNHYRGMLA